jgi:hypothetical protein
VSGEKKYGTRSWNPANRLGRGGFLPFFGVGQNFAPEVGGGVRQKKNERSKSAEHLHRYVHD